jgi:tetratricopeptide (TPR) repeat protein
MAMTGDRELRRDYVDKAVHEFQQIIGDEGRYDEETLGKAYHNLGIAYATLHGLGGDVEMLDCAISSFEQSLEFRRQGSSPLYWAKTKTCIGAALTKRGINLNSVKDLRHALHAFAEAKRVYQQTGDREKNAEVAYNIGCARMSLAAADQNQAGILKAIEDLTFAEAVWEAERGGKWMGTQNALGLAHLNLAAQSADAELALRAVSYFQTGRSVLEKSAHVKEWAGTSVNEARAHMIAGILTEDAGELARALELAEQAFSAISAVVGHPLVYKTNAAIADILVASYNLGGDTSLAVRAAKIYVQLAAALKSAGELGGYLEKSIKAASLMIIHYDATNEPASLATAANILSEVEREHVAVSDHGKEVSAPVAAELLRAEIEARQRRVELGFNSTAVDPQAE